MSDREFIVPATHSVQVSIFNQTYNLRSTSSGERVRQVAKLVDERMRLIASHTTIHDLAKIAVLTALNIADELQSLRDRDEKEPQEPSARRVDGEDEAGQAREADAAGRQEEAEQSQQSWFDAIFDAEMPVRNRDERLSSQVSAKLQSRRQGDQRGLTIEAEDEKT
jgi:cell division protein ZapA